MKTTTENVAEMVQHGSAQALVRLLADLAALETLASTNEAIPDRQASAALFHRSAQRCCARIERYLLVLSRLDRWREGTEGVRNMGDNNKWCRPMDG